MADRPYHPPHPVYHEPPPRPFHYTYGVKDDYGAEFDKREEQDAYGNVVGEYRTVLPDGRIQFVKYHADDKLGFVADVSYKGVPVHPPAPKGGYGVHGPAAPFVPSFRF